MSATRLMGAGCIISGIRPEVAQTNGGESTGLGLSIVKKIVSQKGGSVWVESEGRGAAFCLTWPVEPGA